jgi:endonuclease YncB( thermonuclease family)
MRVLILASAVALSGVEYGQAAETITGRATVVDGDTLEIRGERIRLFGIDAPESDQTCTGADGALWPCGRRAAFALNALIENKTVTCVERDRDRWNRSVSVCTAGGGDLGSRLVSDGWAIAYRRYSTDYVPQENEARAAGRNIFAGTFVEPSQWRRGAR